MTNAINSFNIEANVIGAIISNQEYITQVADFLRPEHFSDDVNSAIYGCLLEMYDNAKEINLPTALRACKRLTMPKTDFSRLLAEYQSNAPTYPSIESYGRIIVENHIRRTIHNGTQTLAKRCETDEDVGEILNGLDKLTDACRCVIVGGGAKHISGLINQAITEAENRQKARQKGHSIGITTGLKRLDQKTGGWKPSQLIVLAGRPAMGKTAVMLHFALSASRQGKAVCIYSLEMASVSLADRLLLSLADVEAEHYRNGTLTPQEWERINIAQAEIDALPIYIDDKPNVDMRYIRTQSKLLQKRGRCDIIFADYLQLVDTNTGKNNTREREVADASRNAKIIAKELGVPFVMLSQLSRKVEERADKTPQLSDLRESGAIEQDADIVVFIHRPAKYGDKTITTSRGEISAEGVGVLSIAKQRDGETGGVLFSHNKPLSKITDYNASTL